MQVVLLALSTLVAVVAAQTEIGPVRIIVEPPPPTSPPLCLATAFNGDGSKVSLAAWNDLAATFPSGNLTWVIPSTTGTPGPIKTFDGTKCLDVRDGDTTNGNSVQVWSCIEGNTNQLWQVDANSMTVSWAGRNKCLDVRDGNITAGNDIQIWDCVPGNTNQLWSALTAP